jgi:hypothetical protein
MTLQCSDTVRNARLDAFESAMGVSARLMIRTGTKPVNFAAANAGTVLADLTLPSDWMASASGGTKAKSGTWQDGSADASGYAGHWRLYDLSGTTCHAQGPCGQVWAGSTAYSIGHRVINSGNIYVCVTNGTSNSSGGPTGTGTNISDGTAAWDYVDNSVGVMELNNDLLASGQVFTVNSFTLTEANS